MRCLDGITNGHEFEQTPGDSEGQEDVACCSPQGCKESGKTERLNNNNEKVLECSRVVSRVKARHQTSLPHSSPLRNRRVACHFM